jgi:hypothetical protein
MAKRKPASVAPVAILPGMTAEQTAEALNVSASPPVADVVAPVASDSSSPTPPRSPPPRASPMSSRPTPPRASPPPSPMALS